MRRYYLVIIITPLAMVIVTAGLYIWVLASHNPVNNPVARFIPWPVACTTRGCITTLDWQRAMKMSSAFAARTNMSAPTPESTLGTLITQHLVHFGQLQNPINASDAKQYRENILNIKNDTDIKTATGLTTEDYDTYVIEPFLEQESLRQQ